MRVRSHLADCTIRPAALADAADVVYLTQRAYAEPYRTGTPVLFVDEDEESLARDMDRGWRILLAHFGGLAVGAVRWRRQETAGQLARLVVDPRHRRRGIAIALLQAAERECGDSGAALIAGEVPAGKGLERYFERAGYRLRAERALGPLRYIELVKRVGNGDLHAEGG
jgi:predicted N-acetyltransferase YhbS